MKLKRTAAIAIALALILCFGGCLKYQGEINIPTGNKTSGEQQTDNDSSVSDSTTTVSENNGTVPSDEPLSSDSYSDETNSNEQNSSNESTTSRQSTTVQTTSPVQVDTTKNGLDILKSGNFYWTGKLGDETGTLTPTEMAVTKDSVYIATNISGANLAMLAKDKKTYIIYPKIKGYMEMSQSIMNAVGIDMSMLTENTDFSNIGDIADADSKKQTTFNGKQCTAYVFNDTSGRTEFYLNGSTLLGMQYFNSSGAVTSSMYFDSISATVPADKSAPPADYENYSGLTKMASFMTAIVNDMDT